jgi:hypothetical protein
MGSHAGTIFRALRWLLACAVLVLPLAALRWYVTSDVFESEFATGRALKAAGLIERGWVPAWFPDEAMDVHEIHDIDTNDVAFAFSLPAGSRWAPPASCTPASPGVIGPGFDRDWLEPRADDDYFDCGVVENLNGRPRLKVVTISQDRRQVRSWMYWSK